MIEDCNYDVSWIWSDVFWIILLWLGGFVTVGGGSDLRLWTVNGDLVGHVHCRESICSVAFSNQPEGVSVNVIAGGLENGVVRLWSTWDLKPVREITFSKSAKPIVSLTFSCDGHHLFTANSDGNVIAWCRKDQQRLKLPMFYSFLSSYAAGWWLLLLLIQVSMHFKSTINYRIS